MLGPRKSAPQERHPQGLCTRGRKVLEQLFPGLNDKMVAQGAIYDCVVEYILWFNHCVYLLDAPNALQRLLIVAEHGNLMRRDYRGAFLLRASTRR